MAIFIAADFSERAWARWWPLLEAALPGERLVRERAAVADAEIDIALVANPAPGALAGLPALRLIQSLWAGVDRLLADATVPDSVPLARMVDPAMNQAMAETALWAVLGLHRGFVRCAAQQRDAIWRPPAFRRADEVTVAVLGQGEMGRSAAQQLARHGYRVLGWRRRPAEAAAGAGVGVGEAAGCAGVAGAAGVAEAAGVAGASGVAGAADLAQAAGVESHAGPAVLAEVLGRAQIAINLLPLTPETRGLFNAATLAQMPAGASLVNLARGAHVVEADLLAALDAGHLRHAVLDVFDTEPLPPGHPFWRHPQITVLPHIAAPTDPRSAVAIAARNVRAWRAGQPLVGSVDRARGY